MTTNDHVVLIPEFKAHYGSIPNYINGQFPRSESGRSAMPGARPAFAQGGATTSKGVGVLPR